MGTIFGGNTGETLDSAEMRSRMAMAMLQNATSSQPIQSPWQGVNQLAQALMGGLMARRAREAEAASYGQLFGALGAGGFGSPSGGTGAGGGSSAPAGAGGGSAASTLSPSQTWNATPAPAGHDMGGDQSADARAASPNTLETLGPSIDPRLTADLGPQLVQVESGGNPSLSMEGKKTAYPSSASGAFQMMGNEWKQFGDPAYPSAARAPMAAQMAAFQRYAQNRVKQMDALGLPVNNQTFYMAHNIGEGGLKALLHADPNANAAEVLNRVDPTLVANNPIFFNGGRATVGQALANYGRHVGGGQDQAGLSGGAGDDQLGDTGTGFTPAYHPQAPLPIDTTGTQQPTMQPGLAPNDNGASLVQPPAGATALAAPQDQPPMPPQPPIAPPQAGEPGRPPTGPDGIVQALMAQGGQQGAQPLPHPGQDLVAPPANVAAVGPDAGQVMPPQVVAGQVRQGEPQNQPPMPSPEDLRGLISAAVAQQTTRGADGSEAYDPSKPAGAAAPPVAPPAATPVAAAAPSNAAAGSSDAMTSVPRSVGGNPLKAAGGGVSEPASPSGAALPVPEPKPADLRSAIEAAVKGPAGSDSTATPPAVPKPANAAAAAPVPAPANASFMDAGKPGSSAMTAYRSPYRGQDNRAAPGQQNVLQALLGKVLPSTQSAAPSTRPAAPVNPTPLPVNPVAPGASGPAASGAPASAPSPQNTATLDQAHAAIAQGALSNPRLEQLRQVAMNPYAPPEARRMAFQLAMQIAVPQIDYITRADGSVVGINKQTGQSGQVLGALKTPSFQEVDDPVTGLKRKVEVDPATGQVLGELTPNGLVKTGEGGQAPTTGAPPAGGDAMTPPPGVNPIKFREAAGTAAGKYAYENTHATFSDEREARKQILEDTPYQHLADSTPYYNAMIKQAKEDTAPADKALIDNFVKIANPGRSVNTGSFILNADAQSLLGGIWGDVKKAWDGQGKLLPDVRAQMLRISQLKMGEYQKTYQSSIESYRDLLEEHGMKLDRVAPKLPALDSWDPKDISTLDTRGGEEGKVSQPKNSTGGDLPKPQPPGGTPIVKPNGVIIQPLGN